MHKEFVPYAESLALKELGFDEPCYGRFYYKDVYPMLRPNSYEKELFYESGQFVRQTEETILSPTYSQAFRFFREFRDYDDWCIESWIQPYLSDKPRQHEAFYWRRGQKVSVGVFSTHDEAQLNLLRKLIELVKTKQ